MPAGEIARFTGLWDIMVSDVDLNATREVLAYADINPEPEPGHRFVVISVEGVFLGEGAAQPAFEWRVSDRTTIYRPSIPGCGVIPNSIYDIVQVDSGDRFSASMCMPVRAESIRRGLELKLQVVGDETLFFDLR